MRRMKRYQLANGQCAMLERLADNPAHFGRLVVLRHGRGGVSLRTRKEVQRAFALLSLLAKRAFDSDTTDNIRRQA